MRTASVFLFSLLVFGFSIGAAHESILLKRVRDYLQTPTHDEAKLRTLMQSGKLSGFYSTREVDEIFSELTKSYRQYVRTENIGESFEGRTIKAYHLTTDQKNTSMKKSKVLFTGLHHARELLTANMIVKLFIEALHGLIYKDTEKTFWHFNDMIIVPVVNIDSHTLISSSYNTKNWSKYNLLRKNRNSNFCS